MVFLIKLLLSAALTYVVVYFATTSYLIAFAVAGTCAVVMVLEKLFFHPEHTHNKD